MQIDVKFVPASCLVREAKEEKYYQFTAIDEYSRYRYEGLKDNSSYSASEFVNHLVKKFPFPILCVHTDNGSELPLFWQWKDNDVLGDA